MFSSHVLTITGLFPPNIGSLFDELQSNSRLEEIRNLRSSTRHLRDRISEMERELQENPVVSAARQTPVRALQGKHIGVFGLTSTGKSTLVNSLLGKQVAATGAGETTTEMTPYSGLGYTIWDAPGRNDLVTYENDQCMSLIKALTHRLILIQSSAKENRDLMRLMDDLGLDYDIVVNKFDNVDEDEQDDFRFQIQREIGSLNLRRVQNVFFISAKHPNKFRDWLTMVDYLTR